MLQTPRMQGIGLHAWLRAHDLHALIVTTADPHLSEYLPAHWALRQRLSGFSGSAGTLVVSHEHAKLWTDSRYWVQAEAELRDSGIALMRAGAPQVSTVSRWLADNLPPGARVGIDGRTLSLTLHTQWLADLDAARMTLLTNVDPASALWQDRPPLPRNPVTPHPAPWACRSRQDNLHAVRQGMREHRAQWHWLSALDDIAWLFNLRGSDVAYNPVFLGYACIGLESAQLFVQDGVLDAQTTQSLRRDGVQIGHYDHAYAALQAIPRDETILIDPARTTVAARDHMQHLQIVHALNPSQWLKSRKTDAELQHIRETMIQDGAALCEFFAWLETALARHERITEVDVDVQITAARARRPGFVSPSFPTIAAFNANAAMPHYQASPASCAVIEGDGLLLIDSGGQYHGGTTDITRMVAVGQPAAAQRRDCTVVLQGMIALSQLVFPQGISAGVLDAIARAPIWRTGADYGHGTGHGVGYFLNVHEGPQSISHRTANLPDTGMQPGMVTSNEPGLYRAGQWGVRIENLVANIPHRISGADRQGLHDTLGQNAHRADVSISGTNAFGDFLQFETLTLCPIDTRCLDVTRLSSDERAWLNAYHTTVRERLSPHLDGEALQWLHLRTQPV